MLTIILGLGLGFAVGAGCRWIDIPVPSPPSIPGALLVLAMTIGFLGTDFVMPKPATTVPSDKISAVNTPEVKP